MTAYRGQRPRPTCIECGKPYGRRQVLDEPVAHPQRTEPPPYLGRGLIIHEWTRKVADELLTHRLIWDRETWIGGYWPFCTLRCALAYARRAYLAKSR